MAWIASRTVGIYPAPGRRSRSCGRFWVAWEWARSKMDRVLFGDNQFFGVNHMSEEKARVQSMRFQDIAAVVEVLDDAYSAGIKTFMCTTHERMREVCDHFRANASKYSGYQFYPCMPYAHKYANAAAELGVLGAVRSFLPSDNAFGALLKGGVS